VSVAAKKRTARRNVRRQAHAVFRKASRLLPGARNTIERAARLDIPWQLYLDLHFGRKPLPPDVLVGLAYLLARGSEELAGQAVHASAFLLQCAAGEWNHVPRTTLTVMRQMYLEDIRRFLDADGAGSFEDLTPWAQASALFRREHRESVS
jgi:hypothetical protein